MGATSLTLLASAAQTATANGATFDVPNLRELAVIVDVTAVSGTTPALTVFLQGSADGGTTFTDLPASVVLEDNNTSATGGTERIPVAGAGANRNITVAAAAVVRVYASYVNFFNKIRVRWVISGTGTPTFTFSVRAIGK